MVSARLMTTMPHGHRSHPRATQSGSGLSRRGKCPPCLHRPLKRWRWCSNSLSDNGMTRRGDLCSEFAGLGMIPERTRGNVSRTLRVRRTADTAVGPISRCGKHPSRGSNPGQRVFTRGCQDTRFWPYQVQNTDISEDMSQNIRPRFSIGEKDTTVAMLSSSVCRYPQQRCGKGY